jgi:uncharacterized membrane protein YdjX (TVP38/TMEM64 family)
MHVIKSWVQGFRKTDSESAAGGAGEGKSRRLPVIVSLLVLAGIAAVSVWLYINRDILSGLERYGYGGIFLTSLLINTTLVMPLPTGILTSAMGAVFNPFLVGFAAGTGAALGETSGYLAGISGRNVVKRDGSSEMEQRIKKYGGLAILILSFIPNPAFDIVGVAAGALKYSYLRFLFWCTIGKVLKMLAFAYFGYLFQ